MEDVQGRPGRRGRSRQSLGLACGKCLEGVSREPTLGLHLYILFLTLNPEHPNSNTVPTGPALVSAPTRIPGWRCCGGDLMTPPSIAHRLCLLQCECAEGTNRVPSQVTALCSKHTTEAQTRPDAPGISGVTGQG